MTFFSHASWIAAVLIRACFFSSMAASAFAAPTQIPALQWEQRSDWLNVKTDIAPAALGDGKADDTAALQNAFDRLAAATKEGGAAAQDAAAVYLPPGTYRITRTLSFIGPITGALVIGSGRDTRLVWDGEGGGKLLHLNGVAYSILVGMELDGKGKAAVGLWYKSDKRFQTEVTHRHLAFRGFTDSGVLNDPTRAQALAETTFENCLFEDCRRGVAFPQFNDYDYTFDGCEFRRCDIGIECVHGNFYVRNCHFEGSRVVDIRDGSEHSSSIRRTTSTGSTSFVTRTTTVAPLIIQDCHVDGWTNPDGAIVLSRPPVMMFDCVFTNPPKDAQGAGLAPVRAHGNGHRLVVSGNRATGAPGLVQSGTRPLMQTVPDGERKGVIRSASQTFLKGEARIPKRVFDARRDFGAAGDGLTDDTQAIQKTVDAAAAAAGDAIAYLPAGRYKITRPLVITGCDYYVGGNGWNTKLFWKGVEGGTMVEVRDPQRVTLENMSIGNHDSGEMNNSIDVHQAGSANGSHMTYDGVYAFGMYQKQPRRKGLHFESLGAKDIVIMPHVQGNLRFTNCGEATIMANTTYEGSVVVEGKDKRRGGLLGFQTRLATSVTHGLYLEDSNNIVMSDFYMESSDNAYLFAGAADDPLGRATIQGAKVQFFTSEDPAKNNAIEIRNYHGQIFFGPDQFYTEPKKMRIRQSGANPVELYLVGCSWYGSRPDLQISPAARVFMIGNEGYGAPSSGEPAPDDTAFKEAASDEVLAKVSRGLDDLRRLGEADLRHNHPNAVQ